MPTKPAKLTAAAIESTIAFVLGEADHNVTAGQLHGLVCAQLRAQGSTRFVSPPTVAAVRRAADRMVGERKLLGSHDAVHAERRYTAKAGSPDAPKSAYAPTVRGYLPPDAPRSVYVAVSSEDAHSIMAGWHLHRNDPGENCTHILGQGLERDEAECCAAALNALAEDKLVRSRPDKRRPRLPRADQE